MKTLTTRQWWEIGKVLAAREAFRTNGALRGETWSYGTGRLPADWRNTFEARVNVLDYFVYSYQTPIAWHDKESGWVVPAESYSLTTTRHQNMIRVAIASFLHESYGE